MIDQGGQSWYFLTNWQIFLAWPCLATHKHHLLSLIRSQVTLHRPPRLLIKMRLIPCYSVERLVLVLTVVSLSYCQYKVQRQDPFALLSATLQTYQEASCDNQVLSLECPSGTKISIQLVQYGRSAPSNQVRRTTTTLFHLLQTTFSRSIGTWCCIRSTVDHTTNEP